jgi:zinc protease
MTSIASVRPTPGMPRPYHFPRAHRQRLLSGATVVVAPMTRLPLVSIAAAFRAAGAAADPLERAGTTQLAADMLLEGTKTLNGAALAERFESLGTTVTCRADWDATIVGMTIQPDRLTAAAALLRDMLQSPAFPQREFDRLCAEHESSRLQLLSEPQALADAALVWACYDSASRYSRPLGGTRSSVDALTVGDVHEYWSKRYSPSALAVVVTGDVTAARAVEVAASLADGLPTNAFGDTSLRAAPRHAARGVHLVEKPDAAQCELRIGHDAVPRSHPDFFPLTVMNAILGGLFSSRINLNLRERNGYTYGANSQFDWRRGKGPWLVSTAVGTEVAGAAIRETLAEIERIQSSLVSPEELSLATSYLAGVFPLRFETTTAVAAALASQAVFELGDNYFDEYRDRIAAVTAADVRNVAQAHLAPGRMQIIAVGDPVALQPQLDALQFGDLRRYSPAHIERAP